MSGVSPPKVAVALEYDFQGAPRVTAKGRGEVAENILKLAAEHKITIEQNPVLAEALSTVELDEAIPEELYQAVATVLTFVLRAQGKLKQRTAT